MAEPKITNETLNGLVVAIQNDPEPDWLLTVLSQLAMASFQEGMRQCAADYATWRDGEQCVGAIQRPLSQVLERIENGIVTIDQDGMRLQ